MGRAYGTPIASTTDGPQIRSAQSQAELRLELALGGASLPGVLWRVEAVSYSTCTLREDGSEDYSSTPPRLELFALPVHHWTPTGASLEEFSGARRRWVRLGHGGKEYASRTPDEALRQFADRRRAQIRILEAQLARARRELRLTEPWQKQSEPLVVEPYRAPPFLSVRPF